MISETFKELSAHMIKGVMLHAQLTDYYDFLNLHGYKRCHEYHAKCEMKCYRKLHRYYINHYDKLIEESDVDDPQMIPDSWYRYTRQDVDTNTKRQAVRTAIEKWIAWETETKSMYEKAYNDLMEDDDIAGSIKVLHLLKEVDKELKYAKRHHLELASVDYDIGFILGEQDTLHDYYKQLM